MPALERMKGRGRAWRLSQNCNTTSFPSALARTGGTSCRCPRVSLASFYRNKKTISVQLRTPRTASLDQKMTLAGGIRFLSPSAGRRLSRADARLHRANKTDGIAQARTLKNVPQRMFHRIKIETNSPKTQTSKGIQVFHGNCSTAPRKTKSDSTQLIPSARNHDTRSTATA